MTRRTLAIVAGVVVLFVCIVCVTPVAVWFGVPQVRTALLGEPAAVPTLTPLPPPSGYGLTPTAAQPPLPQGERGGTAPTLAPGQAPTNTPRPQPTVGSDGPRPAAPVLTPLPPPSGYGLTPTVEPDIVQRLADTRPPDRDLYALTEQLKKTGPIPRNVPRAPEPHKVGDKATFWVNDQSGKRYYEMVATLRYVTDHVYMWVEDGVNASDEAIRRSADVFEKRIYPTTRQYFGEEASPGIDGDVHLYILNGKIPDVGGYFSSADTYPPAVNPYSNQHEMFYINVDGYPIGTAGYEGTLAHEFQHMIHAAYDNSEPSWINEGLSELSARLNGYGGSRFSGAFTANPNTQLTAWADETGQTGPHYGAAYLFASYAFDRFGAAFIKDLVTERGLGVQGYEAALKKVQPGLTFEDVFKDWVIANTLDDPKAAGSRYGYPDLEVKAKAAGTLDKGGAVQGEVAQYAAQYYRIVDKQPVTLSFKGATTTSLIPTTARSGQYMLWSNRGDNMASTLTREFDLTGVTGATLQFAAWYDIEDGWDYAYVEVSTDGGKTFDVLKTAHTQESNHFGNAFGPGLTGPSGGQKGSPTWVDETADLTPYAGKKVLVRLQMITDDAVNLEGLAVDDVRIPELGYTEDFEGGDGGWQTGGWVRTNALLPQRWLVQVIEQRAGGPQVKTVPVGPDGTATTTLDGLGKDVTEAVLVVSALAPVTTERAKYEVKSR